MKIIIYLCLIFLLISTKIFSQNPNWQWAKSTGGSSNDAGRSVAVDSAGNVFVTGYFQGTVDFDPDNAAVFNLTSNGYDDVFITKFDASGNFVFAKSIGGIGDDDGVSIAIDASSNILVTGFFDTSADFDPDSNGVFNLSISGVGMFVLKLDNAGNFIWAKATTTNGWPGGIAVDASDNVYTTGFYMGTVDFDPDSIATYSLSSDSSATPDIYISKLNSHGNFVWAKSMGGSTTDIGHCIAVDFAGNVITSGYFTGTSDFDPDGGAIYNLIASSGKDGFISKLDSNGNFIWAGALNASGDAWGFSLAPDLAGNIYLTGYFSGAIDFDPSTSVINSRGSNGLEDIFIGKYSSAGNLIWALPIGGTGGDFANSVVVDASGVIITGVFKSTVDFDSDSLTSFSYTSSGLEDIFILKLDTAGNMIWADASGGIYNDGGNSAAINANGEIFLTGYFRSASVQFGTNGLTNVSGSGNQEDFFLAKAGSCSARFSIYPDTIPHNWFALNQATGIAPISYQWNWGDSSGTSSGPTPVHTYNTPGNYNICLSVIDAVGCTSNYCDSSTYIFRGSSGSSIINLTVVSQTTTNIYNIDLSSADIKIYPNPANSHLTIDFSNSNKKADISIADITGKIIYKTISSDKVDIDLVSTKITEGIYFVIIRTDDYRKVLKLVVTN